MEFPFITAGIFYFKDVIKKLDFPIKMNGLPIQNHSFKSYFVCSTYFKDLLIKPINKITFLLSISGIFWHIVGDDDTDARSMGTSDPLIMVSKLGRRISSCR